MDAARADAGDRLNMFGRLARACAVRWRLTIALWLLVVALLGIFAPRLGDELSPGGFEIAGSSSDVARRTIDAALPNEVASGITAVLSARDPVGDRPALMAAVRVAEAALRRDPLVAAIRGPRQDARFALRGTGVAFIGVGLRASIDEALRDADRLIAAAESAATDRVRVQVTGGPASFRDFNRVNADGLRFSEIIQVPAVALILVVVLGSLVAAGLPVLTALVSLTTTLGALYFVARAVDLSIYLKSVVPLVGIGVAVDYALFIVNRFREELPGSDPVSAATATGASAGRAIAFSGVTVALALAGMLAVGVPLFTGFAVGTIAVVAVSVLVALTLLPAILARLGPRLGARRTRAHRGDGGWERWTNRVMRRPWLSIVASLVVLVALSVPAIDLRISSSGVSALPPDVPSRQAAVASARSFGAGFATPNRVVVDGRAGGAPTVGAIAALRARIAADPETAAVAPGVARSADGRVAVLTVFSRHDDDDVRSQDHVARILDRIAPSVEGLATATVSVGGSASQNRDFTATIRRNLPRVIALVMLLTFLVLVVLFRSVVIPLKAVVMTLLSSLAAYGVLVMVFQYGWGAGLLGFEPLGHVTSWVPPFLFSILFGLSMDYEVFLLSRIREHRERHGDDRAAVAWGLARTGSVITAAALIMVVVFASFLTNDLIPIKEAALGLAVAIFLDATLVRIVMVPAFMQIAGRWNWWFPAGIGRARPLSDEQARHIHERDPRDQPTGDRPGEQPAGEVPPEATRHFDDNGERGARADREEHDREFVDREETADPHADDHGEPRDRRKPDRS
ncbi:MAG: MMPL family transporter [Actinobacteria bacterium]|nr:MMPL family transporter [Actinomycetota bacterium]